jgi:hypothetical protein
MDDQGIAFRFPAQEIFFHLQSFQTGSGVNPGYRGYLLGVERPGRELDHSPLSAAGVKSECGYTFTPL